MAKKQSAPATQRNREPILEVLQAVLPATGTVLEIASGTGEHAVYFAPRLRPRYWQPSEIDPVLLDSITAWQEEFPCDVLYPPIEIDVLSQDWTQSYLANDLCAIVCINMIHIADWSACEGLITGAEQLLSSGGILYLYGPFKREGVHTAQSNANFDESLQKQNPQWGVRNLEDVVALANHHQFQLQKVVSMPANNLSVILRHE